MNTAENMPQWSAADIADRLGASTIAFTRDRPIGAREIAQMREWGITRIEVCATGNPAHFDCRDAAQVAEVASECRTQGVSVVSLHSPDLKYAAKDEGERRHAVAEGVYAATVAEEMGAGVMVCHLGTNERSEKTVVEMLEHLGDCSIKLASENGQDLSDYTAIVDRVGSDRFGMVVDVGHTRDEDGVNPFVKKDRARETMAQCGDRLIHLHLHDFIDRDHYAPFDPGGLLQWDEVFAAFSDIDYRGTFMFEAVWPANRLDVEPEHVLKQTAAFPQTFAERFGR